MPVMQCSGASPCPRLISLSAIPGGNPAAREDPEGFAARWTLCPHCRAFTCDRCYARQGSRCRCGKEIRFYSDEERLQEGVRSAPQPRPAPPSERPARGGAALPPLSAFDARQRMALWVTMANLLLASADGKITDAEIKSLAEVIRDAALPNVIEQVGIETIAAMASSGALEEISGELRTLPSLPRRRLVDLLRTFVTADGRADRRELALLAEIARGLGVTSTPTAQA